MSKTIEQRLFYIESKLDKLKISLNKYKEFLANNEVDNVYLALKAVERDCEEIVESAVKINQEILETHFDYIAQSYRESFEKLEECSIFNKETLKKLSNTTGFRNRLAHDYMNLDDNIIIKTGKLILLLYSKYILRINDYIKSE